MLSQTITKARARLLVRAPFFGSIALGLTWLKAAEISTMATDGRTIWFNPAWCDYQGVERIMGVIAHEVLHVVNKHHLRRGGRQPQRWNRAADLLINRLLEEDRYELPPDGLFDREHRFAGLSTETIYDRLDEEEGSVEEPETGPQPVRGGGKDAGGSGAATRVAGVAPAKSWGEVRDLVHGDGSTLSAAERRQAEQDLDLLIRQATAAAKRVGKMTGCTGEMVEAATDRVDWRDKLRTAFDGILRSDATWARPNRRFIQHGLYLPGWRRSGPGRVAVIVDTSGSISVRELSVYTAAVFGILEETGPDQLALIQCDAAVRHVEYLAPGASFDRIEVYGRGGTRFQPAFDWIADSDFAPAVIIYATDLDSSDVPRDPGIPVFWLTPRRGRTMPFGTVIPITL